MSKQYQRVAIIGVGLLGGSLGLALKAQGLAKTVVGVGRGRPSLDEALSMGAIDEASLEIDAVRDADLVVICTPAASVNSYLDAIQPLCSKHTVVTDVASTKASICEHAESTWPEPRRFVGSHPMAGSEKWGPEHALATLFEGAVSFVEQAGNLDPEAHASVVRLWEAVGCRVVEVEPRRHDRLVAYTSHLPHVVAAALAQITLDDDAATHFIGSGFRDTTRIAAGRPEIWRDICLTNAASIQEGIDIVQRRLTAFSEALDAENADDVQRFFEAGREGRRKLTGE